MPLLFSLQIFIVILTFSMPAYSEDTMFVSLTDDSELQVQVYSAEGDSLLIILPSEHGITEGLSNLAKELSNTGIETWVADPFTTWFLPTVTASLKEIPVSAYAKLIAHAEKTKKNIYLLSNDKGARVLLESVHEWQSDSHGVLSGVILISPDLYIKTPTVGNDGDLLPVAQATNLPVFIYVASKSTLALRINDTVNALQKGGSDVYVQVLPNVRNRFFFRPDATDVEQQTASNLTQKIIQSMKLTDAFAKQRTPVKITQSINIKSAKTTGSLRKYTGRLRPEDFTLNDITGASHSLSQHRGEVVIVNFWASWCPPCVHEMPSMTKLYNALSDRPFTILAINIGESPEDIQQFLSNYPVSFPVLLDPVQSLPKKWKVFAFPTSYLLDSNGIIRYTVAGGIDWNSEESRKVINDLFTAK